MKKSVAYWAVLMISFGAIGGLASAGSSAQTRRRIMPASQKPPSQVSNGKAYFLDGVWYLPGQKLPRAGSGSNSGQTNLAADINCAQVPCPDVFAPGVVCWKCK